LSKPKLPLTGGCQCGALRYEILQAPELTYACHCRDCQHLTSSAFSMGIVVPEHAFRLVAGGPKVVQRPADSGRMQTRWHCPQCSSWICGDAQPRAGWGFADPVRVVRAGTLDDTSWLQPTVHFWTRSKQRWIVLPESVQVFETQPG
jgi:hypothetical protein